MVKVIQKPIAIFEYSRPDMRNLIVDAEKDGKHFLVGVTLNYKANGIEINSVSGLFLKESHEWIKWIQDGKAIRIDQKEKVQDLINSLRTSPSESERIGLNLDLTTKVVQDFENPKLSNEFSVESVITPEEQSIRSQTQANGTFMQAPNGQPTNFDKKFAEAFDNSGAQEYTYTIDEDAIDKYLTEITTKTSDNLGVHLAALKKLPEIIEHSIDAEVHASYGKKNGVRSIDNGVDTKDALIHRLYGAANIDGGLYRVKTTLKETSDLNKSPYAYQVTKVELLISGSTPSNALSNSTSIPAAKLLQNIEKSYEKGKNF